METVLFARLKNVACIGLAALFALGAFYVRFLAPRAWTADTIESLLKRNSEGIEALLAAELQKNLLRSRNLLERYHAGQLAALDLEKKEALISVRNGVIDSYFGEIYSFKSLTLGEGEWRLIKKNQELYFFCRLDSRIHYLHFIMDMRFNPVRQAWKYPCAVFDLAYSPTALKESGGSLTFNQARKSFYYSHVLKASQNQLIANVIFSATDFSGYFKKRNSLLFYAAVFFMLLFLLPVLPRSDWLRLPVLCLMAFAAWLFFAWFGKPNMYFPIFGLVLHSLWQLLAVLLLLLAALRLVRHRLPRNNFLAFVAFNLLAAAVFHWVPFILRSVNFPCGEFTLTADYLGLLLLLAGLHGVPLLAASQLLKPHPWRKAWPIVMLQGAMLIFYARFFPFALFNLALLGFLFMVLLVARRRFWPTVLLTLLLSLSVSQCMIDFSRLEKEEFISFNLKDIFSAQNQYAKLVAREIVYEINSKKSQFFSFFREGSQDELAKIWTNTLAARESIASGLHVVSQDGRLVHSFSYQIPYIAVHKKDIFPFWHVETVNADLFGKKVNLALATINVFEKERYLGYIMVQVLNSADLISQSYGQQSIFDLNRKITAAGLGYLKVDGSGGILENPANINVENLATLVKTVDAWVYFSAMGVGYRGYVFKSGDESIIIFYPRNTVFKNFSEFIKIFIVLLLLAMLLSSGQRQKFKWRFVFQSFSLKVFAILVLLSIVTAAVFSVFSLNFNSQALETQQLQAIHARGRSALNIINNLLAESGEITQNHLYLLGKILENDITVYENGVLLHTSNHRKMIQSQLPVYLNSGIRSVLQQNNQQFFVQKMGNLSGLYFKTGKDYIFNIEFASNSDNVVRSRQYYLDFLVTVFFILVVIGLLAAFFFRNKILAPIHRLNRGMAEVRQGRFQPLQDMPAEIELRELVQGFNAMQEGIKEQKKNVSEIARMKTLVELGRRVAHEVKNPLTPIKLSAEQILRSLQDQDRDPKPLITSAVRYIIEETDHLRRVAYGFLNLSKLDELKAEPFLLNDLLGEEVAQMRSLYPQLRFSVTETTPAIEVYADRRKIKQVIDNVLTNALEAVDGRDGQIEVALAHRGQDVEVRIHDNGPGISSLELQRIAREEFSSKELGTGLGLVIARRFLELHQGSLEILSHPEQGTTVIMRFAAHAHQA